MTEMPEIRAVCIHNGERYLDCDLADPAGRPVEGVHPKSAMSTGELGSCSSS